MVEGMVEVGSITITPTVVDSLAGVDPVHKEQGHVPLLKFWVSKENVRKIGF